MWLLSVTTTLTVEKRTFTLCQHFTLCASQQRMVYIYLSSAGLRRGREKIVKRNSSVYTCTLALSRKSVHSQSKL